MTFKGNQFMDILTSLGLIISLFCYYRIGIPAFIDITKTVKSSLLA